MKQLFFPGDRVRIRALRNIGSARLLHGLTGEVIAPHTIARGWYKVRLDANHISPHSDWSVPGDRLIAESALQTAATACLGLQTESLPGKHFP